MKFYLAMMLVLGLSSACRTSDSGSTRHTPPPASPPANTGGTGVQPQPTSPQPVIPGSGSSAKKSYILCQVRQSDDRSDYPNVPDDQWPATLLGIKDLADKGYLCYRAGGVNLSALETECQNIGTKLRKINFGLTLKAFSLKVDDETFCDDDKFSHENNRCTCSKSGVDSSYYVVGDAEAGPENRSFCSEAFDFCKS